MIRTNDLGNFQLFLDNFIDGTIVFRLRFEVENVVVGVNRYSA